MLGIPDTDHAAFQNWSLPCALFQGVQVYTQVQGSMQSFVPHQPQCVWLGLLLSACPNPWTAFFFFFK